MVSKPNDPKLAIEINTTSWHTDVPMSTQLRQAIWTGNTTMTEWLWIPQKKTGLVQALWRYVDLLKEKEARWCWEPKRMKVSVKRWKALGITITAFLHFFLKLSGEPIWWGSSLAS
jgi:hypothetical protein